MKLKSRFLVILLAVVFAFTMFAMAACGDDTETKEPSITLSKTEVPLVVGGKATVNATVKNTKEKTAWSIGDTGVATIQYTGNTCEITAVAVGSTSVTAKVGKKTATCTVTVDEAQQSVTITLEPTELALKVGESAKTVTAAVTGSTENVTWSVGTGETQYVSLTPNGNTVTVTPVAAGTATLTAKIGTVTKTCAITVDEDIPVEIALQPEELALKVGKPAQTVTASVTGSSENVTWSVGDGEDAYVTLTPNGNTVTVTPVAAGTATLTAAIGEDKATCAITVAPETTLSLSVVGGEKVELEYDPDAATAATATVTAAVANTTEKVVWSIDSEDVATITPSEDGLSCTVTAEYVGMTTLRATVDGKTATMPVEVTPAEGVVVEGELTIDVDIEHGIIIEKGKTLEINASVKGSLVQPTWSIEYDEEDEVRDVVTLSATTGMSVTLTAVRGGLATLKITIGEGEKETIEADLGVIALEVDETEIVLVNDANDENYTAVITATVEPDFLEVGWDVDAGENAVVTTVENKTDHTLTVTANHVGTTTITVTFGPIEREITVTVKAPVSISVDPAILELKEGGGSKTVEVTVDGTDEAFTYEVTEGDDVIAVTKEGTILTVTPLKEGEATIKVSVGGKEATCAVTVTGMPKIEFTVTDTFGEENGMIWHKVIFAANAEIKEGTDVVATASVNGGTATTVHAELKQSYVEVHAQIAATKYDDVVINYTFKNDGEVVAVAQLNYKGVKEIVLDVELVQIEVGETGTVTVTAVNGNIADKTVTWSIADVEGENVATIPENSTGNSVVVTGANEGKATLTATVGDGENAVTKTCEVEVTAEPVTPPSDVDVTAGITNQFVYNTIFLQVEWNLAGIEGFDVSKVKSYDVSAVKNDASYEVSVQNRMGTSDANVIGTGVQINIYSAPSGSTLTITINFKDGANNVIGHATVNVDPPKTMTLSPTSLTFNLIEVEGADSTAVGVETQTVTATVGGPVTGTIAWTIANDDEDSDEDVATIEVSEDGKSVTVTAVAKGSATITATVDGITKTCKVKVVDPKDGGGGDDDDVEILTVTEIRKDGEVYLIANMGKHFDFSYIKTGTSVGSTTKNTGNNRWDGGTNFLIFAANAAFTPTTSGETYIVEFYDESDTLLARAEVLCP